MLRKSIALCLVLAVAGGAASSWAQEQAAERKVSERFVVMIAPAMVGFSVSPDSKRVAYMAVTSFNKTVVVVDGKEGKAYDGLLERSRIVFDFPSNFHYLAVKDGSIYLVEEKLR